MSSVTPDPQLHRNVSERSRPGRDGLDHDAQFQSGYYERQYRRRWWRGRGSRPLLFRSLLRTIRSHQRSGRLLDVGCGEGAWLVHAARGFETFGVDVSAEGVQTARGRTALETISLASASSLPHSDRTFDVVTALDVLEHVTEPELVLREVRRVLREGGLLVMSTPNPSSLGHRLKGKEWFGFGDPTHVSVLPRDEWRRLLEHIGFTVQREGTDTLWDTPYLKKVPRRLQWLVFIGLSQLAWALSPMFPWRFGENYWCLARRA